MSIGAMRRATAESPVPNASIGSKPAWSTPNIVGSRAALAIARRLWTEACVTWCHFSKMMVRGFATSATRWG